MLHPRRELCRLAPQTCGTHVHLIPNTSEDHNVLLRQTRPRCWLWGVDRVAEANTQRSAVEDRVVASEEWVTKKNYVVPRWWRVDSDKLVVAGARLPRGTTQSCINTKSTQPDKVKSKRPKRAQQKRMEERANSTWRKNGREEDGHAEKERKRVNKIQGQSVKWSEVSRVREERH